MSAVKVFVALPRKTSISEQNFHDHWRHPHSTWGLGIGGRKHYVQSHRISVPQLGSAQTRFDGIAEIWFDSPEDARSYNQDPVYSTKLAPDEPNFVDMRNVRFLVADEEVLISEPMTRNGFSPDEIGWREADRPVTTKLLQLFDPATVNWATEQDTALSRDIGAFRHVRCRPNRVVHAKGAFVSGIRELWWPTLSAFEEGIAKGADAWAALNAPGTLTTLLATAERHL